jgi:hypothetical protein
MVRERNAVRRIIATTTLVVASGALLATSPPAPPINSLDDREGVTATLTAEEPVSSVRVTFTASDEALWSDDREVLTRAAMLYLSAGGEWPKPADDAPRPPDAPHRPIVHLTILPAETGRPLHGDGSGLAGGDVDLLEACPVDLDCLLEYELLVEWIDPIPGIEVIARVEAASLIQIEGPVDLPPVAEAWIVLGEPAALEVPVLSDDVGGSAVVDLEHPLAMWSVVVDATEGAVPAALAWPIEARGSFVAIMGPVSAEPGTQLEDRDVSILLVPESGEEMSVDVTAGGVQHAFDPFAGCIAHASCQRRMTVVVRWLGTEPGLGATVDWRLDAGIVYHGDEQPADGAEVQARIDSDVLVSGAGEVITASADGVIELDSSDRVMSDRDLELTIPSAALATELLGGPVPVVTGTLMLEARSSRPIDGEPVFVFTTAKEPTDDKVVDLGNLRLELNGGGTELAIHPATHCRADRACDSALTLRFRLSANNLSRLDNVAITLSWSLDVRLHYPPGSDPPASAVIRLLDVEP